MRSSAAAVAALSVAGATLLCCEVTAFAPSCTFVNRRAALSVVKGIHKSTCTCPACTGVHKPGCACVACARTGRTLLYADATTETDDAVTEDTEAAADVEVPAEVEAMDGIASPVEAHNAERPARESIKTKKRGPKGKPLSEFAEGDTVQATVKTITNYGAFMDFGAQTDGLVHISRVAEGFVKDVNEVLKVGQEVEARIFSIDSDKGQVALSLLSQEEEERATEARPKRQDRRGGGGGQRRDDSAVLNALQDKGWDPDTFVEGKVVSTVAFGAFVHIDASKLNSEVEGEMDGLVHISSLAAGRVESVTGVVNVGDTVQVRCKGIQGGKVSLSMIAPEDEQARRGSSAPVNMGAKDWREQLERVSTDMPDFMNGPIVVDMRK